MALTITIPGAVETTTGSTAPAVLTVGVGAPGQGVPSGGTSGQVLQKLSGVSYDTGWLTLPADFITSVTAPLAVGSGVLSVDLSAYSTTAQAAALYYPLSGNPSAFLVAADIAGKADLASPALTGNVSITTNSATAALTITQDGAGDILRLNDVSGDTTFTFVDAAGKVNTVASTTASAGLNIAHGVAPTTPVNGDIWTTTTALFARINSGTYQFPTVSANNIFSNASSTYGNSTATGTISLASGATISASTKTLNIGTGGVSGSTTTTTLGPVLGASTTSIGGTTAASTLNLATGATLTATTKAVNIGTAGVAGSTTNIAIGSTTGTSTTTLQGITNGITQTAADSTTALATTAFVTTADNLKANLASPTFTGTPSLPTGSIGVTQSPGNNTTALATTAFVTAAVPAASTTVAGLVELATSEEAILGSSTTLATTAFSAKAAIMSSDWSPIYRSGFTATVTGTGANATLGLTNTLYQMPTLGALSGHSYGRTFGTSQIDQLTNLWGDDANVYVNFAKRIWISGRSLVNSPNEAVYVARVSFGKAEATGVGNLAARGIGWRYSGGASNFVELMVHNGSTLTTVVSSFHPTSSSFSWDIVSDGAGNVTLYINGSSVATTSSGPSTRAVSTQCLYQEEAVLTTTSTSNFLRFYCARGAIYVQR